MLRNRLLAIVVTGSATLALAAGLGSAVADQARAPRADASVKHLDAGRAEHDRIATYWTQRRMRAAVPAEALVAGRTPASSSTVAAGTPVVVSGRRPPPGGGAGGTGELYSGGGEVAATTGKVFFTLAGVDYVCSGSATASTNESLVLTAGHCVNEGPGSYVSNWAFVPGYDNGARPYGTFTASSLVTTSEFASTGDLNYDVAFAVVSPLGGVSLTDTVVGQGIAFNQPRSLPTYAFGYPATTPYDGSRLVWCWGTAVPDPTKGSTDQGLACDMTGGSSGGPWFIGFDSSTGIGVLNSLNSFKYRGGKVKTSMFGPYFGSVAQALYDTAQTL
jgi:hypothetical protein